MAWGGSGGAYGEFDGEVEDARAALGWLRGRYPELPFAVAGFSFGARVATVLGCVEEGARFVLAAGYSTRLGGTEYLADCLVPKVFVQSTQDQYSPRDEFERLYPAFGEPKRVVWIEAGDHFFVGALEKVEDAARGVALAEGR